MIRVLFLEGGTGFGGSAESIRILIKSIDRNKIEPYVTVYKDFYVLKKKV